MHLQGLFSDFTIGEKNCPLKAFDLKKKIWFVEFALLVPLFEIVQNLLVLGIITP